MMKSRKRVKRIVLFLVMVVLVLVIDLPIFTMVLNSFRSTSEIMVETGFWPKTFTFENYTQVSTQTQYWNWFKNSMIVAGGGTGLCIISAALAGYALSRFRLVFLSGYSQLLLVLQMFPLILILIPLFILFRDLKLINSALAPILIYGVVQLPFATWMFRSFFDAIPKDLEEAAMIDGCSQLRAFATIVLPLAGPAIAAVTIFTFLFAYNEFLIANILLRQEETMTIPVGIQMFFQQFSTDWGGLMAAATMAMIPTLILFMFVEKYMIHIAIGSGVKG